MKEVRVEMAGNLPEGIGLATDALFGGDTRFKLPDADRVLAPVTSLLYASGSGQAVVVPEGYVVNDAKVLDMRRAMAVRSYFLERGLSPARVRLALVGNEISVPSTISDFKGMLIVIQYDRPVRLGAESAIDEQAGPPISLGVWPDSIKATKDEGAIIEFSVMDPPQGVASWKFEMLMPAVEGSPVTASLQEVVGDSPVLHQIYWNGRRNYFGELLPFGRYQLVLTARNLRGKETVVRKDIVLEHEASEPAVKKSAIKVVKIGKEEDEDEDEGDVAAAKPAAPSAQLDRKAKRRLRDKPMLLAKAEAPRASSRKARSKHAASRSASAESAPSTRKSSSRFRPIFRTTPLRT
jgi:hypothetical protein